MRAEEGSRCVRRRARLRPPPGRRTGAVREDAGPMIRPLTRRTLLVAVRELGQADPALAASVERFGPPPLWAREPSFATLVHLILEQQVSLASAQGGVRPARRGAGRGRRPERLPRALGCRTPRDRVQPPEGGLREGSRDRARRRVRPRGVGDAPRRRGPREPDGAAWHRPLDRRHLPDHVPAASGHLASRRPGPRDRRARAPRASRAADVRCARTAGSLMATAPSDRREDPLAPLPVGPWAFLTVTAPLGGQPCHGERWSRPPARPRSARGSSRRTRPRR